MGQEISSSTFSATDFAQFRERVRNETQMLAEKLDANALSATGFSFGCEIEAWLVDHAFYPTSINEAFLARLNHPLVVPELSRFNVEINSEPQPLRGEALLRAEIALERLWDHCNAVAHAMDANMVLIGTLPTLRDEDLCVANMSGLKRYEALNRAMLDRRAGKALRVDIAGSDHLVTSHQDIMLEAATTSFQVHLRTPASLAHRYYNASLVASGPLLALSGNSPFLFGRQLWAETRIPLFEQAVPVEGAPRVSFGTGYLRDSVLPFFEENVRDHEPILPLLFDAPAEEFRHLRLHNGTIWRWNRLLLDPAGGEPHLRIEHRILPAGPSIIDMMANAAAYLGMVVSLVTDGTDETLGMPFEMVRDNFYAAARHGLDARLSWRDGERGADAVLSDVVLPRARRGLERLDIDQEDIDRLIGVLEARLARRQTGSRWQELALAARNGDRYAMMAAYCERQRSRAPVHEWDI